MPPIDCRVWWLDPREIPGRAAALLAASSLDAASFRASSLDAASFRASSLDAAPFRAALSDAALSDAASPAAASFRAASLEAALLDSVERVRADSFRDPAARRRFTAATALLKVVVAGLAGGDPSRVSIRRVCPDCGGPHGRPSIVGSSLNVSLSHSGDRVGVAVCADGPVGLDVEQETGDIDVDGMLRLTLADSERDAFDLAQPAAALSRRERAFFVCWTRKESVLKATGDGLRVPMADLVLGPPGSPARLAAFAGRPELAAMARMADLHPGPGYVGAATVLSSRPVRFLELDGAEAFAATTRW